MDIKYLGHASFLVKSKDAKLVTDPYDASIGMKFPKTEADIVTVSHKHPDHNFVAGVTADPLVIDMPGEFEKKGMRIFGFQSYHDKKNGAERGENILYKIETENISVLHCGDLGLVPDDAFLELIGDVDILMVPVGGFYTINAEEAAALIAKIEPSIVIPMHYNHEKLNQKTFANVQPLSEFLKKMGAETIAPIPKLSVKKEDLQDEMKIVVMQITS